VVVHSRIIHIFGVSFLTKQDPDDTVDLIADPDCAEVVARLRSALVAYLTGSNSELVAGGALQAAPPDFDLVRTRARNPLACRGPMRGGMGY